MSAARELGLAPAQPWHRFIPSWAGERGSACSGSVAKGAGNVESCNDFRFVRKNPPDWLDVNDPDLLCGLALPPNAEMRQAYLQATSRSWYPPKPYAIRPSQ